MNLIYYYFNYFFDFGVKLPLARARSLEQLKEFRVTLNTPCRYLAITKTVYSLSLFALFFQLDLQPHLHTHYLIFSVLGLKTEINTVIISVPVISKPRIL